MKINRALRETRRPWQPAYGRRAVLLAVATWTAGCGSADPSPAGVTSQVRVASFTGPTMGTRYAISVVTDASDAQLDALQQRVEQRLATINRQMSTYDPQSELSRFNAAAEADQWFPVSAETAQVVAAALEIASRTSGAFDPTVGPLVDLWGFGPQGRRSKPPTAESVAAARQRIGYEKIEVRSAPPALRKAAAEVRLDLSAIAKGFAVDELSNLLARSDFTNSMVEIGGEVRTRGAKPGRKDWRIGIEQPTPAGRTIGSVVALTGALATSGDYRNFFEADGQRFSHTIDPATGRPVTHDLATVSVARPTCLEADAIATAMLVMGPDRGYDWCARQDIAAVFQVRRAEAGEPAAVHVNMTDPFRALLINKGPAQ